MAGRQAGFFFSPRDVSSLCMSCFSSLFYTDVHLVFDTSKYYIFSAKTSNVPYGQTAFNLKGFTLHLGFAVDIANLAFAIFPVKVRKYIIKAFAMQKCLHHSYFVINANIFVNEQPEWFHWAHRQWPFNTYCTSCIRFRSWSFYRYRKHFGDLDQ